jgi:methyl-accepting chemotaxis protein
LGSAFDQMLNERVTALVQAERENEQLNDSIINLLQAVSQLSQRDLTVKVPVTEDVTGPVADALNLLTSETASVLRDVTRISEQVATASDTVKSQSDAVIAVADNERQAVEQTAVDLASAADTMKQIAELAQTCNATAETAIKSTRAALQTVTSTVSGINSTRDTIRETEKRIKRLGERSQEISGVVNLINTIAERTHILALNASMHAASAGEAGRGFAVVADEVQRLAENAREATSQIATLVSNIQIETTDTVNAMNAAISQVVDGSRLAEQAGDQMKRTQETTADLVAAVQQIASRSQEQARVSGELLDRAQQIQESTRQTSQQLQEQTVQTTNLVEYAKGLLNAVRVFRLPA